MGPEALSRLSGKRQCTERRQAAKGFVGRVENEDEGRLKGLAHTAIRVSSGVLREPQ
jgi:hypothetical protein